MKKKIDQQNWPTIWKVGKDVMTREEAKKWVKASEAAVDEEEEWLLQKKMTEQRFSLQRCREHRKMKWMLWNRRHLKHLSIQHSGTVIIDLIISEKKTEKQQEFFLYILQKMFTVRAEIRGTAFVPLLASTNFRGDYCVWKREMELMGSVISWWSQSRVFGIMLYKNIYLFF